MYDEDQAETTCDVGRVIAAYVRYLKQAPYLHAAYPGVGDAESHGKSRREKKYDRAPTAPLSGLVCLSIFPTTNQTSKLIVGFITVPTRVELNRTTAVQTNVLWEGQDPSPLYLQINNPLIGARGQLWKMEVAAAVLPPLHERPIRDTLLLFDVDKTLTPARGVGYHSIRQKQHATCAQADPGQNQSISPAMLQLLTALRSHVAVGFVGGSNLAKQQEQLGTASVPVTTLFDYCFAENGLTAYRMGVPLASSSFIQWLGEAKYKRLVNWILHYLADLDVPVKRGTFVEFRNGMINVSPVGRNASKTERDEYEKYDLQHNIRADMVKAIQKEFPDFGLTYSIGGQISFDVFPTGWDKTYCLQHVEAEAKRTDGQAVQYKHVHFFGDKTYKGGNDYEIFEDPRTIGHSVKDPEDTFKQLKELFPQVA